MIEYWPKFDGGVCCGSGQGYWYGNSYGEGCGSGNGDGCDNDTGGVDGEYLDPVCGSGWGRGAGSSIGMGAGGDVTEEDYGSFRVINRQTVRVTKLDFSKLRGR